MIMYRLNLADECEALFASDLQSSQQPGARQIRAAVADMIRKFGVDYCLSRVAQEFGDHPETAVTRMRWAREAVSRAYATVNSHEWRPPHSPHDVTVLGTC
jgi:NADPH-dependent 2,4-dienoyl-CoA reductase/sulfur reductase-like enzyme